MTFPNYIKGWLIDTKDGWEDLGEVKDRIAYDYKAGIDMCYPAKHAYCQNKIRVGKEEGELFKYCPVCMVKIKDK